MWDDCGKCTKFSALTLCAFLLEEMKNDTVLVMVETAIVFLKMLAEPAVVIKPPECACRYQEKICTLGAQTFKLHNRRRTIDGIGRCMLTVLSLREMPSLSNF